MADKCSATRERLWDVASMLEFQVQMSKNGGRKQVAIANDIAMKIVGVMKDAAGPELVQSETRLTSPHPAPNAAEPMMPNGNIDSGLADELEAAAQDNKPISPKLAMRAADALRAHSASLTRHIAGLQREADVRMLRRMAAWPENAMYRSGLEEAADFMSKNTLVVAPAIIAECSAPSESPRLVRSAGGETPRCDALDLNTLDSNGIRAWHNLARELERESEQRRQRFEKCNEEREHQETLRYQEAQRADNAELALKSLRSSEGVAIREFAKVLREAFAWGLDLRHKKDCPLPSSNFQKGQPCKCGRDALHSKLNKLAFEPLSSAESATGLIPKDQIEWVVNDNAELGVKIGNQFFWLYKGHSLVYETGLHDDGKPMHWRPVMKREFGECCRPVNYKDPTKWGTVSLDDSDEWKPLPAADSRGNDGDR